jgi:hypothetical protein
MVCVLTVGAKWVTHLVIRQEVVAVLEEVVLVDSAVLEEVDLVDSAVLVDLVGSEEKGSGTLIGLVDLGFHSDSDFYHLTLMKRDFSINPL